MNVHLKTLLSVTVLSVMSAFSHAQAPASAPSGSTGQCKDGSYSTAVSKRGACAGHKGVGAWYTAATTPAPPAPAAKVAPTSATPSPAKPTTPQPPNVAPSTPVARTTPTTPPPSIPARTMPSSTAEASGQVWVNTSTKVYHCATDRYYGKTKQGAYMSEADAKAKGARPDGGKGCS